MLWVINNNLFIFSQHSKWPQKSRLLLFPSPKSPHPLRGHVALFFYLFFLILILFFHFILFLLWVINNNLFVFSQHSKWPQKAGYCCSRRQSPLLRRLHPLRGHGGHHRHAFYSRRKPCSFQEQELPAPSCTNLWCFYFFFP